MNEGQSQIEADIQAACVRNDLDAAATLAYETYGAEIYSFLLAAFKQPSSADDVFSQFNEDFWRGLPAFKWRCSLRAWCYKLARSAANRYRRAPYNKPDRQLPPSAVPWLEAMAFRARTSTRPYLQTEVKSQFQRLRDKLTDDERDLLILRIDRGLSWRDVAHAMLAADQPVDDGTIHRKEVALRQQFKELKERLKVLATEMGLLGGNAEER